MPLSETSSNSIRLKNRLKKCNKLMGIMRRLSGNLPPSVLLTIYKSFIKSHLDYGDILNDKPDNENLENKVESIMQGMSGNN